MKLHGELRWSRQWAGVALPLLAFVLAAPATARASCGDYLLFGNRHAADHDHAFPADAQPAQTPAVPTSQPRPCSGPHCSRSLPSPQFPVATAPVPAEDYCCPPLVLCLDDSPLVARVLEHSCSHSSNSVIAVYHPPRLFPV